MLASHDRMDMLGDLEAKDEVVAPNYYDGHVLADCA